MKVLCYDKNWIELSAIEIVDNSREEYESQLIDWVKSDECVTTRGRHDNDKVDKRYDKNDIFIIFMINDKLIFLVFLDDKSDK